MCSKRVQCEPVATGSAGATHALPHRTTGTRENPSLTTLTSFPCVLPSRPSRVFLVSFPHDPHEFSLCRPWCVCVHGWPALACGGCVQKLKDVQLCSNHISSLPRHIGALTQLQRLWLDWNQIRSIPATVKFLGATLRELKVQGNPLMYPPIEVVVKGLSAIFEWTAAKVEEQRFVRRRGMVQRDV